VRIDRKLTWTLVAATASLALLLAPATGHGGWDPIDPAILAEAHPSVDPEADVEALLWDVWVEDSYTGELPETVLKHRLQLKIYNERGVEAQKQIEIPFEKDVYIGSVRARTVKPDGSEVELRGDDVFERTLVKGGGQKVKVKSFALPSIEPGAVVEYAWNETRTNTMANNIVVDLQRDVPVRLLTYHIKPLPKAAELGYFMQAYWFGTTPVPFVTEAAGFNRITVADVPAFKDEPFMGSARELRRWLLIYYTNTPRKTPAEFWRDFGRDLGDDLKIPRKPAREVVEAARGAVGDASTAREKAARLVRFCRSRIERIDDDASELTSSERKRLKRNKRPKDTLTAGRGTGRDVMQLYLALARAADLDARLMALPDANLHTFEVGLPNDFLMIARSVAVRDGNTWAFFDPAAMYLAPGMLRWQEEGQQGIVSDPDAPTLSTVPCSTPGQSVARRSATLRLEADGTLEGDVREELTGHLAAIHKEANDDKSAAERKERLEELIHERLSTAELSEIVLENVGEPEQPFVRKYHVRIPGYAQRTGRRLFLQPCLFEKGGKPLFPASRREHPVRFPYAWEEEDHVRIELPAGFELEAPSVPNAVSAAPVAGHAIAVKVEGGKVLDYQRSFYFGGQGNLLIPAANYAPLKSFFDRVHEADQSTFTLKVAEDDGSSAP